MLNWIYDIKVCQIGPNVTTRNLRLYHYVDFDISRVNLKRFDRKAQFTCPIHPPYQWNCTKSCLISTLNQVISNNNFDRIRITESYLSTRWLTVQSLSRRILFKIQNIQKVFTFFHKNTPPEILSFDWSTIRQFWDICFYPERWHHF